MDKYAAQGKYKGLKVDDLLGYGHLGSKGSPILTNDLAGDDLSINYVVGARIVGKSKKSQKLNLMAEQEYCIRFIPFGFHTLLIGQRDPKCQLKDMAILIEERLNVLKTVFQRLKNGEPIKNTDIHGTDLVGTFDDGTELNSSDIMTRKMNQLHMGNNIDKKGVNDPSLTQEIKDNEANNNGTIESKLTYKLPNNSISLFSKFLSTSEPNARGKNGVAHSGDKAGLISISAGIPQISLQYASPSLLKKVNSLENKTKHGKDNWLGLVDLLDTQERAALKYIDLNLSCIESNNCVDHEPPKVKSVHTELICITAKSQNSIPINLNAKLLLNSSRIGNIGEKFTNYLTEIQRYYKEFKNQKDKLNKLYNTNMFTGRSRELKFTDFIPNELYSNIESLSKLKVKIDVLKDVFKEQTPQRKNESSWTKKSSNHYERELRIDLEYSPDLKCTLPPCFESCLCCRFYCVRVHIEFHSAGSTWIDIPVIIKNFVA